MFGTLIPSILASCSSSAFDRQVEGLVIKVTFPGAHPKLLEREFIFLELNPMGKVPVIVHAECVLTESTAICAYLADVYPDAQLAPPLHLRDAYYRWLFFAVGCLEPAAINNHLGVVVSPEQEGMVGYRTLQSTLDTIQWQLGRSIYVAGDTFTAADVYVGSQISWGIEFATIEKRQVFEEYIQRVSTRPAAIRAAKLDVELATKQGLAHP